MAPTQPASCAASRRSSRDETGPLTSVERGINGQVDLARLRRDRARLGGASKACLTRLDSTRRSWSHVARRDVARLDCGSEASFAELDSTARDLTKLGVAGAKS